MTPPRGLNEQSLNLIKDSEGWRGCAYKDPIGKLTIGYGHLVQPGDSFTASSCVTKAAGTELLKSDVSSASASIGKYVKVPLNDNEHGALSSWAYNVGSGNVKSSTLVKELNSGNKDAVCDELKRWNKAGGKVLPGLVNRREKECELFKSVGIFSPTSEGNSKNMLGKVFGPIPDRRAGRSDLLSNFFDQ